MKKLIKTRATRNDWLKHIYAQNLVRADKLTRQLSDKLYSYSWMANLLGAQVKDFLPLTIGLRKFVTENGLVAESEIDVVRLTKALADIFPHGCIIKPCAVINTGGETPGYFFSTAEVIAALSNDPAVRQAALRSSPYFSDLLQEVVSGEEFVLQENVPQAAGFLPAKAKTYTEMRVHTFEDKVVPFGIYARWKVNQTEALTKMEETFRFSQAFLKAFPSGSLQGQAWAMDVLIFEGGYARIIDVNTNRGQRIQWSGYLARPTVIGAYTRLFEQEKGVVFAGWPGFLLRNNWGNYFKFLKKYYVEGIR